MSRKEEYIFSPSDWLHRHVETKFFCWHFFHLRIVSIRQNFVTQKGKIAFKIICKKQNYWFPVSVWKKKKWHLKGTQTAPDLVETICKSYCWWEISRMNSNNNKTNTDDQLNLNEFTKKAESSYLNEYFHLNQVIGTRQSLDSSRFSVEWRDS